MIEDPLEQFRAMWQNLRIVLDAANCTFEDVVEMTSYHVEMSRHMDVFRAVRTKFSQKGRTRGHASAYPNSATIAYLPR